MADKVLVAYTWYNPGGSFSIIGLALYWNGFEFKAVIGLVQAPSIASWDIHHIMDWGSKFGLDAAILELQQNGSIEDRTLWDKLLGERGAKSSP